jgi:hypothetical protein
LFHQTFSTLAERQSDSNIAPIPIPKINLKNLHKIACPKTAYSKTTLPNQSTTLCPQKHHIYEPNSLKPPPSKNNSPPQIKNSLTNSKWFYMMFGRQAILDSSACLTYPTLQFFLRVPHRVED